VAVVVVALGISLAGEQVARAGFALVQPESVIAEAIDKDPTSPIALAAAIRSRNRGAGVPLPVRLLLPILAAVVMAGLDPRRRPAAACVGYGVALLALYGWSTSHSPAFQPLVPSAAETVAALALVCVAGLAGSALARRLADGLGSSAQQPHRQPPGTLGAHAVDKV
jgi:hypothetical protein